MLRQSCVANPLEELIDNAIAAGAVPGELVFGRAAFAKMRQDVLPYTERPRPWMQLVYIGACKGVPMRVSDKVAPFALVLQPRLTPRSIEETLDTWRMVK